MADTNGAGDGTTNDAIGVLAFAGSLRKDSLNRRLIGAAIELAPEGMRIEHHLLNDIPVFNQDVEAQGDPEPVAVFKQKIRNADAILIATPEYGYSIPGVLKNAIDWASRPAKDPPLYKKPIAVMGATTGMWGTARAQAVLRQSLFYNRMYDVKLPEVMVRQATDKFDEKGKLTDETTRDFIRQLLEALAAMTHMVRSAQPAR